jgi:uncharacterized membrane protein
MPNPYSLSPVKPSEPGRLVVIAFGDELSGFSMRELLCEMEEDSLLEIGDAVVATRNGRGQVRLHQSLPLVPLGTAIGSFAGLLLGVMVLNPLFGAVTGAAAGAAASGLRDAGIEDAFMKEIAAALKPGTSALFVFVRKTNPDEIIKRLERFAGQCSILQTTMSPENEARLRQRLDGAVS